MCVSLESMCTTSNILHHTMPRAHASCTRYQFGNPQLFRPCGAEWGVRSFEWCHFHWQPAHLTNKWRKFFALDAVSLAAKITRLWRLFCQATPQNRGWVLLQHNMRSSMSARLTRRGGGVTARPKCQSLPNAHMSISFSSLDEKACFII